MYMYIYIQVRALGAMSVELHEFIMPVLVYCVDPSHENSRGYLLEHALDLWSATIQVKYPPLNP